MICYTNGMLSCRDDFPILQRLVHGRPLVYLDSAATAQKPRCVVAALSGFYEQQCGSVHRATHALSEEATQLYEQARGRCAAFVGAACADEIVFVRGATEGMNLLAHGLAPRLQAGDEVVVSVMEHHSGFLPWQRVCAQRGARLRVASMSDAGVLDLQALRGLIGPRTRVVSLVHVSHVLGTVNPVQQIGVWAHEQGAVMVVDGAQAVSRLPVNVQQLGCDAYLFSGHKMYGPMGIGVLYARGQLLQTLPAYQLGGGMVHTVGQQQSQWLPSPLCFEAGTPNVADAVALSAAMDYIDALDRQAIAQHDKQLLQQLRQALAEVPNVQLLGSGEHAMGVVSFAMQGVHPHDVACLLDQQGVAVRAGHLCAQPLMQRLGLPAVTRASVGCYNTYDDVVALVEGLHAVRKVFAC